MKHELIYALLRIEQYGITTCVLKDVIGIYQIIPNHSVSITQNLRGVGHERISRNNYMITSKYSYVNGHKSASFGSSLVN
jgi:hypothetical protein